MRLRNSIVNVFAPSIMVAPKVNGYQTRELGVTFLSIIFSTLKCLSQSSYRTVYFGQFVPNL